MSDKIFLFFLFVSCCFFVLFFYRGDFKGDAAVGIMDTAQISPNKLSPTALQSEVIPSKHF